MSDRFEEAVRQAARGLSTTEELPLYHDAWARGRRRRLVKRGALGIAGAAIAFAAIGIGSGGLGGPQSFETDDVATGLDVVATTTPTPAIEIPTTGPTTIPSPVPGSTGSSGDAAAGTELVEETPVAPPQPTATSAVTQPAVTATPPAATATPVPPAATAVATTPPAPPVPTIVPPPVVLTSPTEVPTTVAEVEPALPEPTPTVPFEYSVPGPTATSVATTTSPQPTSPQPTSPQPTSPQPTATSVPSTATQSPETDETPSADEITSDESGDIGGDQASDELPTTAAAPPPPPVGQRVDPTALADAVIDPNVVPEPDARPCDSSYDGTFDALCETLEPYPCVDQVEATPGYTAIDTTGDGVLDTCEALNTTSCDTDGDLLADVPCIISILTPDQ